MSRGIGSRLSIAIVRGRRIASGIVIAIAAALAALAAGTSAQATTASQAKATRCAETSPGRSPSGAVASCTCGARAGAGQR
jgi:hypothetical protein